MHQPTKQSEDWCSVAIRQILLWGSTQCLTESGCCQENCHFKTTERIGRLLLWFLCVAGSLSMVPTYKAGWTVRKQTEPLGNTLMRVATMRLADEGSCTGNTHKKKSLYASRQFNNFFFNKCIICEPKKLTPNKYYNWKMTGPPTQRFFTGPQWCSEIRTWNQWSMTGKLTEISMEHF